jgi:limonene-1,2-epoxide hydrolase
MLEDMTEVVGETAHEQQDRGAAESTPTAVVERFLDRLRATDSDGAADLLAVDVEYENKGLPTIHGRERVRRLFQAMNRVGTGFEVYVHLISADGSSVLTERTDVLKWGRLRIQFWVCGRFDVRDGEIVVWRDYFDHLTILAATMRGLLGMVVPGARAKPPSTA